MGNETSRPGQPETYPPDADADLPETLWYVDLMTILVTAIAGFSLGIGIIWVTGGFEPDPAPPERWISDVSVKPETAARGETVRAQISLCLPEYAMVGQQITVRLGPDGLWDEIDDSSFDFTDPNTGKTIAEARVDNDRRLVIITLKENNHEEVHVSAAFDVRIKRNAPTGRQLIESVTTSPRGDGTYFDQIKIMDRTDDRAEGAEPNVIDAFVFEDWNGDGRLNEGEELPYATVVIKRSDGAPVLDYLRRPYRTKTQADTHGRFIFLDLEPLPNGVRYITSANK